MSLRRPPPPGQRAPLRVSQTGKLPSRLARVPSPSVTPYQVTKQPVTSTRRKTELPRSVQFELNLERGYYDYGDYSELRIKYLRQHTEALTQSDVPALRKLEESYCRVLPKPPELQHYTCRLDDYWEDVQDWAARERSRALTNYSPDCLPAARALLQWKPLQFSWNKEYLLYIDKIYEDARRLARPSNDELLVEFPWLQ